MSEDEVIFIEENGVGIITLNRPDRLNALTYPMVQKINKYLNVWEKKESIILLIDQEKIKCCQLCSVKMKYNCYSIVLTI